MNTSADLMQLLTQRMSYLNQQQAVQTENVANASTPGYEARELAPFSFADAMKQAGTMRVTDPRHIVPASMAGANAHTVKEQTNVTTPSGNTVDVEQEMMRVSQTSVSYQLVTSVYHKMIGLLKIAVKGNSG